MVLFVTFTCINLEKKIFGRTIRTSFIVYTQPTIQYNSFSSIVIDLGDKYHCVPQKTTRMCR